MSIIDIHSHIIPGIDDGSQSPEMSLRMLSLACADGVSGIVATSHSGRDPLSAGMICDGILRGVSRLRRSAREKGLKIDIYPGMELFANDFLEDILIDGTFITINGSRFLLTEFDFFESREFIDRSLITILDSGLCPVIAHPERYAVSTPAALERWLDLGCVIQINAGSVTGMFGESAKEKSVLFLREGLVHVAASDAHSDKIRNTAIKEPAAAIKELCGAETARLLFESNPSALISNKRPRLS
ncbi:MAG: hypothetical protein MJ137_02115 [Clostridia bacterium]|nr:hypothetical protein [Clostridia bacterium]